MRWPRSSSDWYSFERLAFFGLLALSLIPILVFTHFPTEDGPLHMANAAIYRFADSPLFREFYEFSLEPIPNMTADVALSVLLGVMKAELAHKVMALLLAIGLPLAFRWCLSSIRRDAVWLAALVIPVAQGRFLYNGYWNFQVGVVLALVTLGHWMAFMRRGDRSPVRWLIAVCLFLITYLSHALPFLLLLAMVGAVVINEALAEESDSSWGRRVSLILRRFGPVLVAALIPILLYLRFQTGVETEMFYLNGPLRRLIQLPGYAVVALSGYEIPFAGLLVIGIIALALRSLLASTRWEQPGFLILTAVLIVGFFVVPDVVGEGSDVAPRFAMFIMMSAVLWVGREPFDRRLALAGVGLAAVVVLGLMAVRIPSHAVLDEDISEYLSGREVLEQGTTVLPLWMAPLEEGRGPGGGRRVVAPLVELAGFLMDEGEVIDLHHLSPALDIFPFRFATGLNIRETVPPEIDPHPFSFGPEMVDIEQYVDSGARVDYVWLWGRTNPEAEALSSEHARSVLEYIDTHYRVVFVSEPRGMLEVYALK